MKQVNFWDIPQLIKYGKFNFDGDKKDLRLHSDESFRWGAKTKTKYNAGKKAIDRISAKGNGWQIYAWYDVSSFEYWMKQMEETNYIQITISFDAETIDETELSKLDSAIDNALAEAEAIENQYNYDPSPYND
tara:strand:+ start:94 stop:492 length:399 start_codon:yes stop_codon:yes gene_type:complete